MECNRDEAVRARDSAIIKGSMGDFSGAKKFIGIAQKLFPTLEGLSEMLQVNQVHTVARNKIRGIHMDWYGILQVDPSADDRTIRKQYKKLALVLHPDKNAAMGAEAAFKLVGAALEILSDQTKRAKHDLDSDRCFSACPKCNDKFSYERKHENSRFDCTKCGHAFVPSDPHTTAAARQSKRDGSRRKEEPGKEEEAWRAKCAEEAFDRMMADVKEITARQQKRREDEARREQEDPHMRDDSRRKVEQRKEEEAWRAKCVKEAFDRTMAEIRERVRGIM